VEGLIADFAALSDTFACARHLAALLTGEYVSILRGGYAFDLPGLSRACQDGIFGRDNGGVLLAAGLLWLFVNTRRSVAPTLSE
jgi:hypothetical protein